MADTIDTQSIIDRVKNKAAPIADEEGAEGEAESTETDVDSADAHLGEAFDALKSGNRDQFVTAMKACLASGYNPPA